MIKIFNPQDINFSSNGNICINPKSCVETKKKSLNGWYLNIEIDIKYREYIKKDNLVVVKSKSNSNPQAFRIADDDNDNSIEYTDRSIFFKANHVCFDSRKYFLVDVRPTRLNATAALEYINERTDQESPFIVSSDISTISTSYFIRKNLLEAWQEFEKKYEGYFLFDNWKVKLSSRLGRDTEEIIAYGQKLQNFHSFESWANVVTKLYPVGQNGIMLDEEFLLSDIQYDIPYTKMISFESDLELEEQTDENLKTELKKKAQIYLDANKYPLISYQITSDINQNLDIGDVVHIKHPLADIKVEVLEYSYDHVQKRITSIIFGNYSRSVKSKIDSIKQNIIIQSEKLTQQEKVLIQQSELINNLNKNGYVYIDENEILILDALPKTSAKNVWRFGLGGLAFSSNGYEGPFTTAITQDGKINADFISTGKISTNLIEGYDQLVTRVTSVQEISQTNQSQIDALQTNMNNNFYTSDQIDANNASLTKDIVILKNTLENVESSTSSKINIIEEQIKNGVTKVTTTSGTFDENGLHISKSGEQMSSTFDWDGLAVKRDEEEVLTVRSSGVNAENMMVRNYFIQEPIRQEKTNAISDSAQVGLGFFYVGGVN